MTYIVVEMANGVSYTSDDSDEITYDQIINVFHTAAGLAAMDKFNMKYDGVDMFINTDQILSVRVYP